MLLAIALLLAGQAAEQSDLALTRNAFAGLCGNLASEATVLAAAEANGWMAVTPDPNRRIGRFYALEASESKDAHGFHFYGFHAYRKVLASHILDALVYNVANTKITILHCQLYMDDGRAANLGDVTHWGKTEPFGFPAPHPAHGRMLEWREPGVFATHAITTVELAPRGQAGIEISAIGVLSAGKEN